MLSGISIIGFAACYAVAFGLEMAALRHGFTPRRSILLAITVAGILLHTIYLASQAASANGVPISTKDEWPLAAAWMLAILYLGALFYLPRIPTGVWFLPMVLAFVIGSRFESHDPLPPDRMFFAWGLVHGLLLLLGTVSVCVGFLAGSMYLVQSYALKHVRASINRLRLPSLEWLERVNSRTLGVSTVLIALGFASGLMMSLATHRGESAYTLWTDPVVLSLAAMLIWLIAAEVFRLVYPAARRGRKVAYLTLASFLFLVIALASFTLLDTLHASRGSETAAQDLNSGTIETLPPFWS